MYVYCMTRSAPVTPDQPTQTTTAHAARDETGAPDREPRVIPLVLAAGVLITAAWLVFLAWMVLAVILYTRKLALTAQNRSHERPGALAGRYIRRRRPLTTRPRARTPDRCLRPAACHTVTTPTLVSDGLCSWPF